MLQPISLRRNCLSYDSPYSNFLQSYLFKTKRCTFSFFGTIHMHCYIYCTVLYIDICCHKYQLSTAEWESSKDRCKKIIYLFSVQKIEKIHYKTRHMLGHSKTFVFIVPFTDSASCCNLRHTKKKKKNIKSWWHFSVNTIKLAKNHPTTTKTNIVPQAPNRCTCNREPEKRYR